MKKFKVFIDGQEGTTGLQLKERLLSRADIELLAIDDSLRKDPAERKRLINLSDVVFLCLPDAAAKEAVGLVENPLVKVIDASTAHRVAPGWTYGFAELSRAHREKIAAARRITNPGCHATGFISVVYPLVRLGLVAPDYPFTAHSITGYSGGGKKMIAQYESEDRPYQYDSPRQYGLSLNHKHLPEMQMITGICQPPIFNPIVCDFYSGMAVSVPLFASRMTKPLSRGELQEAYAAFYEGNRLIEVTDPCEDGFLAANELRNTCRLRIYVNGNDEQMTVTSVFDNLGKGASGAAVQNMNIALGVDEYQSLL